MAKSTDDQYEEFEEFEEFENSYGPDLDLEMFDDTTVDDMRVGDTSLAAWQRIERRKESDWLRSQVVDWDDWDEYFDSH